MKNSSNEKKQKNATNNQTKGCGSSSCGKSSNSTSACGKNCK